MLTSHHSLLPPPLLSSPTLAKLSLWQTRGFLLLPLSLHLFPLSSVYSALLLYFTPLLFSWLPPLIPLIYFFLIPFFYVSHFRFFRIFFPLPYIYSPLSLTNPFYTLVLVFLFIYFFFSLFLSLLLSLSVVRLSSILLLTSPFLLFSLPLPVLSPSPMSYLPLPLPYSSFHTLSCSPKPSPSPVSVPLSSYLIRSLPYLSSPPRLPPALSSVRNLMI